MSITIRPAGADDRDTLLAFLRQLQDAERGMHPSRLPGAVVADAYYAKLVGQPADILLAASGDRAIGFVAGWLAEDADLLQTTEWRRHGWISDLFVVADHRRRGVGAMLLQAMGDRLREWDARRLRICAIAPNAAAISVYRRFGFELYEITFDKPLT